MSKLHKSDTFDSKDKKCQLMPFYYDSFSALRAFNVYVRPPDDATCFYYS